MTSRYQVWESRYLSHLALKKNAHCQEFNSSQMLFLSESAGCGIHEWDQN